MSGLALALAVLMGAAVGVASCAFIAAVHWWRRARLAEALLERRRARRSEAVSRGNQTRAARRSEQRRAHIASFEPRMDFGE